MRLDFIALVAGIGALAHFYLAYKEIAGWGPEFVQAGSDMLTR
jgi:hypothetical protein